ncbi:MAG: flagellar basal body rod protein FlgC [Vampirovibrionales bacterium]|nr:flagellar basal body rod protein FlgC [Vampirovibrionales bacterium]
MDIFDVTGSALSAQRLRLDVIAGNLANVNTTRKADGSIGAYRRKNVVFAPLLNEASQSFAAASKGGRGDGALEMTSGSSGMSIGPDGKPMLRASISASPAGGVGVQVDAITDDSRTPMRKVFDPSHPDADAQGYVELPNINVVSEMVDMISATRAYEANVTALQSAKSMIQSALEI